jgi:hypothetical protein
MSVFPLSPSESSDKPQEYSDHERELLDRLAKVVVKWNMSVPAIMALESVKPLNYIGSQAMVFAEPMAHAMEPILQIVLKNFSMEDYNTITNMLERRHSIEALLLRIEYHDSVAFRKEKLFKRLKREYLKQQPLGTRIKSKVLGFKVPSHLGPEWKAKMEAIDKSAEAEEKQRAEMKPVDDGAAPKTDKDQR